MSLLSIARSIAVNVGISAPSAVLSNDDPDAQKIVEFTQAAGEEVARRADWGALRKSVTITGNGAAGSFSIGPDFARLVPGNSITVGGVPVRTGMTADEWNSLTPVEGTPRYAYLAGGLISFYPYLADGATASVVYQSKNWCGGGTSWQSDSDTSIVPEVLIKQGALWRWRRQLGQDFQDFLAEFEASLVDQAKFDDGMRLP